MTITSKNGNKPMTAHTALLDLNSVYPIVGEKSKKRRDSILKIVEETNIPPYLIGDSGSGKSHIGQWVLKAYSMKHKVPAYYVQLSPEDTKTSILLGLRLVNGTLEVVDGLLARAAREKAIVFIDEITHSTLSMLLMFNSIDGGNSKITVGDEYIDARDLRIIYGSNRSNHAGNIRVPQSFANRVVAKEFDYPDIDEQALIARETAKRKMRSGIITAPDSVFRYLSDYVDANRTKNWPLSARNIAHAVALMEIEDKQSSKTLNSYFTSGANNEALRRQITKRILGKEVVDVSAMQKPEIYDFVKYVSDIGIEAFKRIVMESMSVYIDMEGVEIGGEAQRQKLMASII
jgi:MoxR-like ATPase